MGVDEMGVDETGGNFLIYTVSSTTPYIGVPPILRQRTIAEGQRPRLLYNSSELVRFG